MVYIPLNGPRFRQWLLEFVSICASGSVQWQAPKSRREENQGRFHPGRPGQPEIIRWAKPFAAILNWLISPNGISRAAACDRKPAANPSNADFGPIFLIMHEVQPDRRTFPLATEFRRHSFAWSQGGPLAANHILQTRRLWRKLGRVAEIGVKSPVADGRVIIVFGVFYSVPNIGGVEARKHFHHRTIIGEYGRSPGFQKTREVFHAAAVLAQGRLHDARQKRGVDGGGCGALHAGCCSRPSRRRTES